MNAQESEFPVFGSNDFPVVAGEIMDNVGVVEQFQRTEIPCLIFTGSARFKKKPPVLSLIHRLPAAGSVRFSVELAPGSGRKVLK